MIWRTITNAIRNAAISLLGLREYEAGRVDRLTGDLKISALSADADIVGSLLTVRGRARTMEQSDAYTKKYVGLVRANIPGPLGYRLQSRVAEYDPVKKEFIEDTLANTRIEEGWVDWCRRENCTVTGDMSFREFTHIMSAHFKRDGEFLARRIAPAGKYGFQLQALEPDLLDERLNARLANGNRVIMGVEIDRWRKIVAFWLRKEDDGRNASPWSYSMERQRIDARDVYFGYDRTRAFQTRGMSSLATAMLVLHDNRQWEKASLVNARHSAGRLGFLYDDKGEPAAPMPGDETESDGTPVLKLEAGSLYDIGMKKFQGVDPNFPHQQHKDFVASNLRRAAAGAEVSYYSLSNDYESTSYSSGRLSYSDERERWKMDQQYLVEALLEPIFRDWLEMSLTTKAVNLPLAKFDKFNCPEFVGRTWDYVDPLKDVQADILAMNSNLMTKKQYFAERGKDIEDVFKQLKAEREMEKEYGIESQTSTSAKLIAAAATNTDNKGNDAQQADANARAIAALLLENGGQNGNGHHG